MDRLLIATCVVLALVLGACRSSPAEAELPSSVSEGPLSASLRGDAPPFPDLDDALIVEGAALYQGNCASCHLSDLSGSPNWKVPSEDGIYPPPPMDESGHTWHHPDVLLTELIQGERGYESAMPEFADTLTPQQINAILEFIKSNWDDQERQFQWQATWQELDS